jgi:DNA mismatch repair protein MutL
MIIDQKRAHERILFERYLGMIKQHKGVTQGSLFPETLELSVTEINCLMEIFDDIRAIGFDLEIDGETKVIISGCPADIASMNSARLLKSIIAAFMNETLDIESERKERIAIEMARASAIPHGKPLTHEEMKELIDHLFACETPNFSPSGKSIINILNLDDIEKRF